MEVKIADLVSLRETISDKQIILALGTFDLFHYEHLKFLEQARFCGEILDAILVVAIKDNECAKLKNPTRPIIDQDHRIAIVDALACVDYTLLVDYESDFETCLEFENEEQKQWLSMFEKVFDRLRPDILYHEENPKLQSARDRAAEHYKFKCISKKRNGGISTSNIIKQIVSSER